MKNSEEYLFEYTTPQSQDEWSRRWRFWTASVLTLFWACVFVAFMPKLFLGIFRNYGAGMLSFLGAFFSCILLGCYALLSFKIICDLPYDPHLTVRILQEVIFLRQRIWRSARSRYIYIVEIRNISEVTHGESHFASLMAEKYYKMKFTDDSIDNTYFVRGAELELRNGRRVFVGFKGAEKFVEALNDVLVRRGLGSE